MARRKRRNRIADEVKVGDWIRYPVNGLEGKGEVLSVDYEAYGAKAESGGTIWVAKGHRVEKIATPQEE